MGVDISRVTFINPLFIPAAREDEFLEKWDKGAAYVREREGFVSTSLHRSLDRKARFQYFTVAVWESAEHFYQAMGSDWWREYVTEFGFGPGAEDFRANPTLCEQIRE